MLDAAWLRPGWVWDVGLHGRPHSLGNLEPIVGKSAPLSDFQAWIHANFDPSVSWKDVEWVRGQWNGPLIIKGILDADDARAAADSGADGIVVSNHGGRQLDGVLSTARALPPIADAVGGRIPILVDGGVRSGLDVVRMLALGADFVLLGPRLGLCARGGRRRRGRARAEADRSRNARGDGADRLHPYRRSGSFEARLKPPAQATFCIASPWSRNSWSTSATVIGSAKRKPWTDEQPWARSSISCAVSSTPSAVVSIPSALASSVIAWTIALAPSRVSRLWMKLRSIFNLSNGKLCR